MTIITLTTDFGTADGFVGVMKGVILSIAPAARFVDLSHEIVPQDVRHGAYVLARALDFFPPGTIHLAVVDPGVGSDRRALAVTTGRALFVGPDNGLLTPALAVPGARAYAMDRPEYWLPEVSQTFHGRDVFAPLAAHLTQGVPVEQMGHAVSDPARLSFPAPVQRPDGSLLGEVTYIDRFGNLITNIPAGWLDSNRGWRCQVAGATIPRLSTAYAAVAPGALLALAGSSGSLEIALRDGSAAARLAAVRGTPVLLSPKA